MARSLLGIGLAMAMLVGCTSGQPAGQPGLTETPPATTSPETPTPATRTPRAAAQLTATPTPAATVPASPVPTATLPASATPSPSAAPSGPRAPGLIPDVQLVPAFPQLPPDAVGNNPLYFSEIPDGSRRGVIVDQNGKVFVLRIDEKTAQAKVFLDLSARVSTAGNEEGLLGLAFASDFPDTGTFYVYYSAANPRRSVLSSFRIGADPDAADPESEHVILEVPQPFANHNGGMLVFGPDGYLYVGLGDGGSGGDPNGNGQNPATLLGSILRIDVREGEAGRSYRVPADNPFTGRPETEARHEVWAYGLRNPWRFSFDRATGNLWAGDVGQNAWEEIDLVVKGGNYGWNIMEGGHCFRAEACDMKGLVLPVAEYATGQFGCAVTGGYVYRGERYEELKGLYLYADFCSGLVWALGYQEGKVVAGPKLVADTGMLISSFGEDRDGELYVTVFGGAGGTPGVYRVALR